MVLSEKAHPAFFHAQRKKEKGGGGGGEKEREGKREREEERVLFMGNCPWC